MQILTPRLSGDADVDALLGNYVSWEAASRSADRAIQFSFTLTTEQQSLYSNVTAFSAEEQASARVILAELSALTGIEFTEVADGEAAQLHFGNGDLNGNGGIFDWRTDMVQGDMSQVQHYDVDGYVYLATGYGTNGDVVPGHGGYELLLHEIGHALGMRHPHDGPTLLDPDLDNNAHTVMTYDGYLHARVAYQELDVRTLSWRYGADGLGGDGEHESAGVVRLGATSGTITGGAGHDYLQGSFADDTILGGRGNDLLIGSGGRDVMRGGAGDDTYLAIQGDGDVIDDSAGIDTVYTSGSWTLAAGLENLRLTQPRTALSAADLTGNAAANLISGNGGPNLIRGLGGDDRLFGSPGNDTLRGAGGDDTLTPGAGFDSMEGGAGRDTFNLRYTFWESHIADFQTGIDLLSLDGDFRRQLGEPGRFAADDSRFYAASGVSTGHDADDRVLYDTSSGRLWFDPDGSGPQSSEIITILQPGALLSASDVEVRATRPEDLLLTGTAGADTLSAGAGDDRLDGGPGVDNLAGGAGDDVYFVDAGDTVTDSAGSDWIYSAASSWHLGDAFEGLLLLPDTSALQGTGNPLDNRMVGNEARNPLKGNGGDDALLGNAGNDVLEGGAGNDVLIGGTGRDGFVYRQYGAGNADHIVDFGNGADTLRLDNAAFTMLGAAGRMADGDARFYAAAGATAGHDASDRLVYDTASGSFYYDADGSGAGAAVLVATLDNHAALDARDVIVI